MEPLPLTDDERQTALDAAFYRSAKLKERSAPSRILARDLPVVVIREGEQLLAPDRLNGQIIRAGTARSRRIASLVNGTFTREAMRRDLAVRDAARGAREK